MKIAFYALAAVGMLATGTIAEAGHGCHSYGGYYPMGQHYSKSRVIYQDTHVHDNYMQPGYMTLPVGFKGFTHYADMKAYGCKGFFCPQYNDWFYFYPQKNVYMPVKYIQQFAPVANRNANLNDNDNFNRNDNDNFNRNANQNVTNITIAPGALNTKQVGPVGPGPVGPGGPGQNGPFGDILPMPVN